MFKRFFVFLTVCFLLMPTFDAHAYWRALHFIRDHFSECEKVYWDFYPNGDDGYVFLRREPGMEDVRDIKINNNVMLLVRFTYNNKGELWGFIYEYYSHSLLYGWIPMSQLLRTCDSVLFFEEHESEFYPYTGNYEELKTAERVILWPWPGSGRTKVRVRTVEVEKDKNVSISYVYKDRDGQEWSRERLRTIGTEEIENLNISYVYKDKDGREWGLIARCIQDDFNSDVWVCVSDPGNDDILEFNPPRPGRQEYFPPPHIFTSGDNTFISDVTEENENEWIGFSTSLKFRGPKHVIFRRVMQGALVSYSKPPDHFYEMRQNGDAEKMSVLWQMLNNELTDATDPERFKIPYAFAFDLTPEEHVLCEEQPDEILNIIQGKKAILTWISPEIQWGDKLRIRYLRDYIKILKENGFVEWAETVESIEDRKYFYDDSNNLK